MMSTPSSCQSSFAALAAGASALRITLPALQRQKLVRYCELLLEANQSVNLTAVREPAGVMRTLFLDSLTLVPALPENLPADARVVDVGSGAGIPGLVLKVLHPRWRLALIESVGKKARFL